MRRLVLSIAAATTLSLTAHAEDMFSFSTSEDFQEKLEDDYGERELDYLTDEIREDLTRELGKAEVSPARIDVTILDAKPNRPTFEQLGAGGLSFESFSIGGMDLKAVAYNASGEVMGELEYDWFENDIRDARFQSTWGDARRASGRFARKFAKEIAG